MKFTKEQLAEKLKAQLTANGKKLAMSERTLNGHVERIYKRLEKTNDEELELNATVEDYFPDFEELEGNYRKDNADFIKDWETKHPAPKDVPANEPPKPTPSGDEKYNALFKQVEEIRKERENEKTQKAIELKRSELISKFKADGVNDDEWLNDYVNCINISSDTDVDAQSKIAVKLFNKSQSHQNPNITPISTGGGEPNQEHIFDDVVAMRKRKQGIVEQKID